MLLEKPFATSEAGMWAIYEAAQKYQRTVMICHVLRYSTFYAAIRQRVQAGEIGDVINVQTNEHVAYRHMAVAYIRGKWARKVEGYASMLMAKCSHDLDLITWIKSGIRPLKVASFGSNMQFKPQNAPAGAGTRCLLDCPIEAECQYSARKHYLHHSDHRTVYVWSDLEHLKHPTIADKEHALRTTNPYGKCVWKTRMDVVDHQSVLIEFEDGCTATHNMVGGTAKPSRAIHVLGTLGEIYGKFEDNHFVVRHFDQRAGHDYTEDLVDLTVLDGQACEFGRHGGGDLRLVEDFVRVLRGKPPSISTSSLDDSINGHAIGFAADRAMEENRVIFLNFPNKETY